MRLETGEQIEESIRQHIDPLTKRLADLTPPHSNSSKINLASTPPKNPQLNRSSASSSQTQPSSDAALNWGLSSKFHLTLASLKGFRPFFFSSPIL